MSDTPKTDELAKREFVADGVWIRHARELERENAALRAHAERVGEANDRLVVENNERGLRLVTIEEIIDDSHRSNKAKVLALKWMLGRKEAQP